MKEGAGLHCTVHIGYTFLPAGYTGNPSIPDTLGPERTVMITEVSSFQELKMFYDKV